MKKLRIFLTIGGSIIRSPMRSGITALGCTVCRTSLLIAFNINQMTKHFDPTARGSGTSACEVHGN